MTLPATQPDKTAINLPRLKVEQKGTTVVIVYDHPDRNEAIDLLMEAMGAEAEGFFHHTLLAVSTLTDNRDADGRASHMNQMLATVAGIRPRDQLEGMLAVQMATIHDAMLTEAARLKKTALVAERDFADKALNKLARTFATQVEALKRYRSKGEQRVYVERVDVSNGGQAIVGNVSHEGGGGGK